MHHPRPRHYINRRSRCASAHVVYSPDDVSDPPEWADAVAHLLLPNEVAHIKADAFGWRWEPAEVAYDRNLLLLGGPVGMAITGIASTVVNRRTRRRAERAAAPAWRSLGPLVVIATNQRLLVWYQDAWWSIWRSAVVGANLNPSGMCVDVSFVADPPYRIRCAEAASLLEVIGGSSRSVL